MELDRIIGRDAELTRALHASQASRLVTLTGPGGSGKTRLAEAVVEATRAEDQVAWFVDLSSVNDVALTTAAIVSSLRIDVPGASSPIDAIAGVLGAAPSLLVLDNVEQLPEIGDLATELLAKAPRTRIVATSRVPLHVRGEVEVQVPPLALPADVTPEAVEASGAGQLFLVRSRALGRLQSLDPETARALATLLQRLDGVPLAIELAAARTRVLTPAEIVVRLEQHGSAAIDPREPDRHRSLAGILEWTLSLLPPVDRSVLEALSVCAGFDLALAEAICDGVDPAPVLESVVSLGLVVPTGSVRGSSRFRLLETIRQALAARLPADDRATALTGLSGYVRRQAERWYAEGALGTDDAIIDAFDADADNVRRALEWLGSDPELAAEVWFHLEDFWRSRGRLVEGLDRLDELVRGAPEPTVQLARAAATAGAIAPELSDAWDARAKRGWELATAVADPTALVMALYSRLLIAFNSSDRHAGAEAAAALEKVETDSLSPRMQARLVEARTWAVGATQGIQSDDYVRSLEAELVLHSGRPTFAAYTAGNFAQSRLARGEYREAARLAGEAIASFRSTGRTSDVAWMLGYRAAALAEVGDIAGAVEAAAEGAELRLDADDFEGLEALVTAMPVAIAIGRPLLAAHCWGAALRSDESAEHALADADRRLGERWLKRAVSGSSQIGARVAVENGRGMHPRDITRDVLTELKSWTPTAAQEKAQTRLRHGELTRREVEILSLVAAGRNDSEIGEQLFISAKTASVHVTNAKAKLGVKSRLELAIRAREMGLG